jgi:hypothetical protein
MRRIISVLALVLAAGLLQVAAYASGSISAGKGINPRDAYTMGKALTFEKLVCPSCPLQKRDLDRERALSLKNSLEARDEAEKPGTPDDDHINALCPGAGGSVCEGKPDEQELVHFYLTRRYKL